MPTQTPYETRPFREEDREPIVQINNRDRPAHRQNTAAAWERQDRRSNPERVELRLVVGDPVIAFLSVTDFNTTSFKMADVCDLEIVVGHAHRRQGLGAMLYEKAFAFAKERGAKRIVSGFREWSPEEPAIAFLRARGFTEMEREKPSYLDLTNWDPSPFRPAAEKAQESGVRFLSYAEVEDTEENRHRFYELQKTLIYDIPRRDEQPFTFEAYDDWVKFVIERPEWRPDLCLLAEVDGEWVGQTHVVPKLEFPHVAMQWLTGTLKTHRGKGIATALKVVAYERAIAAGCTVMTAENHEDNAPMLAINRKFGFIPEPTIVVYNKVLNETADETKNADK